MQVTEEYIFSGGTSNRDYATLIEAVRSLEVKLIIACRPEDVNLNNCPPNVQVAFDAYGDAFEKLIADSFLNVIPLKDIRISSGQICLLKAMSYAKPIVATAAAGVEDYIDETCAYLVPPGSSSLMRTAIFNAIMNRDEAIRKGALGYKRFMDKFSVDRLGEIVGGLFNVEAHGLSSLQCDSYCP
jgi:glycosyltransferase involved in cell wall biosynthesis